MGFSRQESQSGFAFPSPGDLPDSGIHPDLLHLLHWQAGSWPLVPLKRASLSPKSKGPRQESESMSCSVSLLSLHQFHTLCPPISFHNCLLFIKPDTKTLTIQSFLWVISLWRLLCHIKLMLNKCVCCSPVNLFLSNFQTQPGTQRGWRKTFSSSTVFILWFCLDCHVLFRLLCLCKSYL